jgi:hypothetical protein
MPLVTTRVVSETEAAAHDTPGTEFAVKERADIAPVRVKLVPTAAPAGVMTEPLLIRSWPAVKPEVGVEPAVKVAVEVPRTETGKGLEALTGMQEVVFCPLTTDVTARQSDAVCWAAAGVSPIIARKVMNFTRPTKVGRGVRKKVICPALPSLG